MSLTLEDPERRALGHAIALVYLAKTERIVVREAYEFHDPAQAAVAGSMNRSVFTMNKIEPLERLLSQGHDNAILRFGLGQSYLTAKQPSRAALHFERAVAHDPDYSAAWKGLGQALTQVDRADDAIVAFEAGMAAAERKGDAQAGREMEVFLKRLRKRLSLDSSR